MKRMTISLLAICLLAAPFTVAYGGNSPRSNLAADRQIVFLHFHADSNGISFVDGTSVVGTLKAHRAESLSGDIYYEVESSDSTVLYSGSFDDPLQKKLEYEDPDSVGVIRSTLVHLDEADFILRVRYDSDMAAISFYKTTYSDGKRVIDRSDRIARTRINLSAEDDR